MPLETRYCCKPQQTRQQRTDSPQVVVPPFQTDARALFPSIALASAPPTTSLCFSVESAPACCSNSSGSLHIYQGGSANVQNYIPWPRKINTRSSLHVLLLRCFRARQKAVDSNRWQGESHRRAAWLEVMGNDGCRTHRSHAVYECGSMRIMR